MTETASATPLELAGSVDPDPGLALGRGLPNVPWTIRQRDRIYNVLLAGGQGSGKSSMLLRLALGDALASNTATVVLDMKGTLSERLVRLVPPDVPKRWWNDERGRFEDGTKRIWYLDLGHPAFGLTPLRVEPGWQPAALADEFSRIADAITRALLDLFPGQIMGSSEDLIERAVVGTMAIAWWEHERRCERERIEPEANGFSGSFEVLSQMFAPSDRFDEEEAENRGRRRVRPNRWHQAAGRACQKLPNLDQVADTLLYEIPRQARDNLGDIAKRMEAPANKIRPLVGAAASVRRFVGHPERLSLRSVIEAHDTLIINPRIELIGEDQASILTNFIVHMVDLQMKRQVAVPRSRRPRVSLVIDEAHRLVTDTLITMTATHREAGLTVAAAVQYVSQLGADAPSGARREKIAKGVGNLLQTKVLFRMSDSEDANQHSQIFRSVYETMVRADPTSRARMPFDPSRMQTLRDHHALVSLVCSADDGDATGLIDVGGGATRLPAFVTQTFRMPELEDIADRWREVHLGRQAAVFTRYPEDMSALAVRAVPAGLAGEAARSEPAPTDKRVDARSVAEATVGHTPDAAIRKNADAALRSTVRAVHADVGQDAEWSGTGSSPEPIVRPEPRDPAGQRDQTGHDPRLFDTDSARNPSARSAGEAAPGWERVGGVQIERAEEAPPRPSAHLAESPVLATACRPTSRTLPEEAPQPATGGVREALQEAAAFEAIVGLPGWLVAGDDARRDAKRAAGRAREEATAEAEVRGLAEAELKRLADGRVRRAVAQVLDRYEDAGWRAPVKELEVSDPDTHTLEVIARLRLAAPRLLGQLLDEPPGERVLRERLARLHDAGLIARAEVAIQGRRGRRPRLYAVAARGLEYLRARHTDLRPDRELPAYLDAGRQLPSAGRGSEVPHELALHLTLAALRQFGGTATQLHWHTTRMPGGRWDLGMVHSDRRDRRLRVADLVAVPGMAAHGEQLDAQPVLEPDLSVQLQGPVDGERAVLDMLIEVDRTGRGSYNHAKFIAYDHFLGGWCLRTRRWGKERGSRPLVVFVGQTARAALSLLGAADAAMSLGFAERGQYDPTTFAYPGRAHTAFTTLEWLVGGLGFGLRLPALPPRVRGSDTPLRPERVALLPEEWWLRP